MHNVSLFDRKQLNQFETVVDQIKFESKHEDQKIYMRWLHVEISRFGILAASSEYVQQSSRPYLDC